MTMFLLDSHCHLNDDRLFPEAETLIKEAYDEGVKSLLVIGWDLQSSIKAVEIASLHDGVYAAVGYQPENTEGADIDDLGQIAELAKNEKVIAIGEIGLDYHWDKQEKTKVRQKRWFRKQLELAAKLDLPVSIHSRDASEDVLEILSESNLPRKGVLHCYSGSPEMLQRFAALGYYFGFDGPITYKNAKTPKECVVQCPLDRLLSETDSPYLPPTPHRGETNYPKYIPLIVNQIAELRGDSAENIALAIKSNFERLFHVKL